MQIVKANKVFQIKINCFSLKYIRTDNFTIQNIYDIQSHKQINLKSPQTQDINGIYVDMQFLWFMSVILI